MNSLDPEFCNIRFNHYTHYCSNLINILVILKTLDLKQEGMPFASERRTVEEEVKLGTVSKFCFSIFKDTVQA